MTATALAAGHGQGLTQTGEVLLAFALSSIVGLERSYRGKSAGLRTQAIVGTAAALFLLVSKYGFGDVLSPGVVSLDPSRVAGQIVSGIGFLGAGLIISRRGAVRGLTTAATVWETAAIGMAAGAGLPLLAVVVTGIHLVIVLGYTPLGRLVSSRGHSERTYAITYLDGGGVLRNLLSTCTAHAWTVNALAIVASPEAAVAVRTLPSAPAVSVELTITGSGADAAAAPLGGVPGVLRVDRGEDDDD